MKGYLVIALWEELGFAQLLPERRLSRQSSPKMQIDFEFRWFGRHSTQKPSITYTGGQNTGSSLLTHYPSLNFSSNANKASARKWTRVWFLQSGSNAASCLAENAWGQNFVSVWWPPFDSRIALLRNYSNHAFPNLAVMDIMYNLASAKAVSHSLTLVIAQSQKLFISF